MPRYEAQLRGSAYDDINLRQWRTMTAGVRWNETCADPASDRHRMLEVPVGQ